METSIPTGLGEAFASYQPSTIDPATWARLRPEFAERFATLGYEEWATARPHVARVAHFMADALAGEPQLTLEQALTRHRVEGYLRRLKSAGENGGTLLNRQATLNQLLRGERQTVHDPTAVESRQPLLASEVIEALESIGDDASASAAAARQLLTRALSGRDDGLSPAERRAAKLWLVRERGRDIDLKRLRLLWLAAAVETRSARDVAQIRGVGRRSLSAAVTAVDPAEPAGLREVLRGPR